MSARVPCPRCNASMQPGAPKCAACRAWVGPPPPRSLRAATIALLVGGLSVAGGGLAVVPIAILGGGTPAATTAAPAASSSALVAAEPSASASAKAPAPPIALPLALSEPRSITLPVAPADVAVADDDASVFVLGDDGSVYVVAMDTGRIARKIAVPGKGSGLRLLGKSLAVVGAAGTLPVVDVASGAVGKLDVGGSGVDAVAVADPPAIIAAGATSRRVVRFLADGYKPAGDLAFARPVSGLVVTKVDGKEIVSVLLQGKRAGALGTIESFDPAAPGFGASRTIWTAAADPHRGDAHPDALLVVDRAGSQLFSIARGLQAGNVGPHPIAAYRVGHDIVSVEGGGTATLLDADSLEPRGVLALGGAPSAAASFPDGRGVLVALGGGTARDRGATAVLITGDPPDVATKLNVGPGAHAVTVGKSGRFAVVTSYYGKSIAIVERR